MKIVPVELAHRSYDVVIAEGLLANLGEQLSKRKTGARIFVISNPVVFDLYGRPLLSSLTESGFETVHLLIPDGEQIKNLHTAENIYTYLIAQRADRTTTLVALGGGVTGDIVGFVAATFMRGIPYVQVPTTLLAQVDSSVGGKTGVNHSLGKNLIGAFHQPILVAIDLNTLSSLPEREFRAGLFEVVKYGLIYDQQFFDFLESNLERIQARESAALETMISRCCEIKAAITSLDERETDLRRILNFGHTLGHALEAATEYQRFKHGEAVAYGTLAAVHLSHQAGTLSAGGASRISRLVLAIGSLPSAADVSFDKLAEAMRRDKKRRDDQTVFVLLDDIGRTSIASGFEETLLSEVWARALAEAEA
jgi:3-dehydroquinate synthase